MLSPSTGYAATALAFVAAAGGRPVLVREVAEAADIPAPYLSKIIHTLSKRGLVNTQRGIGGGVCLARPADQITLRDLCEALADPVLQARCLLGTAECSDERNCPAHKFWKGQRTRILEYIDTMTIADVAAFEARRQWRQSSRASLSAGTAGPNSPGAIFDEPAGRGGELPSTKSVNRRPRST